MIQNRELAVTHGGARIHTHSIVMAPWSIGEGTIVWAFARIFSEVEIGEKCSIGTGVYIGEGTKIGSNTRIGDGCHITDHMVIGERCFIAPHAIFCNDRHPVVGNTNYVRESPIVEDDVSVGVNATILPGVRLGKGCVVGAGSVVTRDVPPGVTVVGNPAKPVYHKTEPATQRPQGLIDYENEDEEHF